MNSQIIAFIGGGNMASALIGGLVRAGQAAATIVVVEPAEAQRAKLLQDFGVVAQAAADARLAAASTVVWAVKPQLFAQAAAPCATFVAGALQLSVMAGIRSEAIVQASGSERVVRAMPNTPALIGQGIAGLFARPLVDSAARATVDALFAPERRLLAHRVDARHLQSRQHDGQHHTRQAAATADIQNTPLRHLALYGADHGQAIGQMLGEHGRPLAHRRQVVGGVPMQQQVQILQQGLRLRWSGR